MKKNLTSAQWLRRFLALALAVLAVLAVLVYIIDPYYNYRAYDHKYKLDKIFSVPGVVKNYDYDAIVIGSSMTQNFDMDSFRQELGQNPIKATLGGITGKEISALFKLAQDSGHAQTYYICIDNSVLSADSQEQRFPDYLMDFSLLNDYKYFWGYEAWMRFIPLNLGLLAADSLGIELPQRFSEARSIDLMGDWAYRYEFSADRVLSIYSESDNGAAINVDMAGISENALDNCEVFVDSLDLSRGDIVFFFPPYSSLLWYKMEKEGSLESTMELKRHFMELVDGYDNVKVYDFQGAEFTSNLDNYMDLSHYSPEINDFMVSCFASGDDPADSSTLAETERQIRDNIQVLLSRYPELEEIEK
ncbi:MAG: hypothetical protein V8T45_02065 [Oscillospiraceae bacterium]